MSLNNYGYCVHCLRVDRLLWPSRLRPGFFTCCDEPEDDKTKWKVRECAPYQLENGELIPVRFYYPEYLTVMLYDT